MPFFIIMMSVTLSVSAQYDDVSYGIEKIIKNVPENEPVLFWKTLKREHPQNVKMIKALNNNNKSMMEALGSLPKIRGIRNYVINKSVKSNKANNLTNLLENVTKISVAYPDVKMFVVNDDSPNAGMYPDGTCEINSYWLSNNASIEELIAISCHEIGHFIMQHRVRDTWKTVKAAKRNQMWAQIGTGIAMGAYAGSQIYAAQNGVAQSNQAQQQNYTNIAKAGVQAMYNGLWYAENRQKFSYERDSEVESDIIAFWFMEKNGVDPIHLINLFKRFEAEAPKLTKKQRKILNHPEWSERVKVIEKLYKKHHKTNFVSRVLRDLPTTTDIGDFLYIDENNLVHTDRGCQMIKGKYEWCKLKNLVIVSKVCNECVSKADKDKIYGIANENSNW